MIGDGTEHNVDLPCVFLAWKDGYMIKKTIESKNLNYAMINIPLNLTFKYEKKLKKAPWSIW